MVMGRNGDDDEEEDDDDDDDGDGDESSQELAGEGGWLMASSGRGSWLRRHRRSCPLIALQTGMLIASGPGDQWP